LEKGVFRIITTPEANQVSQMITWYRRWRTKLLLIRLLYVNWRWY